MAQKDKGEGRQQLGHGGGRQGRRCGQQGESPGAVRLQEGDETDQVCVPQKGGQHGRHSSPTALHSNHATPTAALHVPARGAPLTPVSAPAPAHVCPCPQHSQSSTALWRAFPAHSAPLLATTDPLVQSCPLQTHPLPRSLPAFLCSSFTSFAQ